MSRTTCRMSFPNEMSVIANCTTVTAALDPEKVVVGQTKNIQWTQRYISGVLTTKKLYC